MIEGNGPKWLFDIDSLTQSMNYVPVAIGTISNESADASYFDSPSKDVGNGEPNYVVDDQKQVEDGPYNKSDEKDKSEDDSSPKEVNAAGQQVNIASPEVNTGRFKLNTVDPSVNTTSSYKLDSPQDMFKLGSSHTLETTHIEFFSDKDEPEVDLGNIINSYTVPTTPNIRIHKHHPIKNVIRDVKSSIQTRRMTKSTSEQGFLSAVYEQKTHDTLNTCFLLQIEPTSIAKALSDSSWVEAMQEELMQFKLHQGHRQEEGIDYEEVFAPVARIKAIRLFLAYASFMGFLVYLMSVEKECFLFGTIEEDVDVTQPLGFKDPEHPDKVYKVVKALYGLHQAPRAWYETLANYLLGNGFKRGKIDQTLFIKKQKGDILLVWVYVDDIIFGSTNKELCTTIEKLMKDKFQMSSMGELTFFLGLQVTQREDGIFISQDKYVAEILKKFNYIDVKSASTLVDLEKPLVKDGDVDDVDCKKQTVFATSTTKVEYVAAASCCGQAKHIEYLKLKTSPLKHVKRGWDTKIPQSSAPLVKVGDEAVHKELGDRMEKATTTASSLEVEQDNATARTTDDGEVEITASIDGQVKTITEASLRRHLKLEDSDGITSLPNTEIFEQLALMGYVSDSARLTFQKGHFSPQWRFFIHTILHCLSPKTTAWEQFSSNIATAIICLATNRTFNFSKMIFDAMVKNLDSTHKFLMYPRFLQICLNKQKRLLQPHTRTYPTPTLTQKLFSNMKRVSKGYSGFTTQTQVADEATFISVDVNARGAATTDIGLDAGQDSGTIHKTPTRPHDSPLPRVHTLRSDEGSLQQNELMDLVTKLTDRLEKKVKTNKARRRAGIVISEDEDAEEGSFIQGRKISDIDKDLTISLVQPEQDMEYDFDVCTAERFTTASVPITTASAFISTTSATLEVSTAAANLVYIKRSAEKRKDKGKAIMKDDESIQKKSKKDAEIAKQLQAEFVRTRQEQEVVAEADQAHDIDWSDPAMIRYHALQNKSFSVAEIRKNMCMKNQGGYKLSHFKRMSYEDIRPIFERV
ncbi:putative ribonuclease H-like domain-containing protein [Tanacetum coccineum]